MDFNWHWPDGSVVQRGPRLAYDIETNGLLPDVSTIHSLVVIDVDSGTMMSCAKGPSGTPEGYHSIEDGLAYLKTASMAVGHNVYSYDSPVIKHLIPSWEPPFQRDTLILAKMIWPVDRLKELDFPRWRKGKLPGNLIGAHKLEAWGYRLGQMKGEYSATVKELSKEYTQHGDLSKVPEEYRVLASVDAKGRPILDPWLAWNKPMQVYCEQDVRVTVELFKLIESHLNGTAKPAHGIAWSPRCVELEHRVWLHCDKQAERGFGYDLEQAIKLTSKLRNRQRELEEELKAAFGSWWQPSATVTPKIARNVQRKDLPNITARRVSPKTGKVLAPYVGPPLERYSPDAPYTPVERTEFNPKSRKHLGDRLQAVFGWQPVEFGGKDDSQAKVDETTIKQIEDSILPPSVREMILEYLVISKTLGQLADGRKSWNDLCGDDGAIHGRVDPLGTVSHRGAHKDPNLGQVPSVSVKETKDDTGKVVASEVIWGWKGGFGAECRSLFRPKTMPCQTGTDASGLELRLLGHYLHPYDDGAFATRVSTPGLDIHAENAKITGLTRADTKTTTYAFLYGAGNLKIGIGVGVPEEEVRQLASASEAQSYIRWMRKVQGKDFVMPDDRTLAFVVRGGQVSRAFLEGITGLKDLKKQVTEEGKQYGFILALDGRKLVIRKPHASLNQLLQGGGAIVCKEWMMETDRILREEHKLIPDKDYGQMAWVHDELQIEHQEGLNDIIAESSDRAIKNVARMLDFRGELATDSKHGSNWKACH
ncbi:DNA polymerase [Agrobacterium sp. CFBP2214]|uniref:DNA polymerase n=1 Tax=Agrobacterium sp. CFBP2214 TaxID=3040274 RepID=UPI000DD4C09E|nr:DNA polymerase [Agrobacterium sp. CFBP2214]